MSDSEDDYMSESFLAKCEDHRPGLVSKEVARKYKIEKQHTEALAKNKFKPKAQLEQEHREKGLGVSISSDNKGFSMLQKMGFKPGMVLGKKGTGRSEPIPVEVKLGRKGLGHETEQKRKKHEWVAMRNVRAEKRRKLENNTRKEFSQRQRERFDQRNAQKDLYKSQKVCEQLDSQVDITEPAEKFFWPESLLPKKVISKKSEKDLDFDDDGYEMGPSSQPGYSNYVQDVEEEEEEGEEEEEEEEDKIQLTATEMLEVLTLYLRNKHKYCIWCGTKYEDRKDMESNCPGNTAEAHDD